MSQETNLREFSIIAGLILKTTFGNFPMGTDVDLMQSLIRWA